jgi:hypothetical protein
LVLGQKVDVLKVDDVLGQKVDVLKVDVLEEVFQMGQSKI